MAPGRETRGFPRSVQGRIHSGPGVSSGSRLPRRVVSASDDFLIIAPYNAPVFDLEDRILGARIGTVDKFQGQEAPIVIYLLHDDLHAYGCASGHE